MDEQKEELKPLFQLPMPHLIPNSGLNLAISGFNVRDGEISDWKLGLDPESVSANEQSLGNNPGLKPILDDIADEINDFHDADEELDSIKFNCFNEPPTMAGSIDLGKELPNHAQRGFNDIMIKDSQLVYNRMSSCDATNQALNLIRNPPKSLMDQYVESPKKRPLEQSDHHIVHNKKSHGYKEKAIMGSLAFELLYEDLKALSSDKSSRPDLVDDGGYLKPRFLLEIESVLIRIKDLYKYKVSVPSEFAFLQGECHTIIKRELLVDSQVLSQSLYFLKSGQDIGPAANIAERLFTGLRACNIILDLLDILNYSMSMLIEETIGDLFSFLQKAINQFVIPIASKETLFLNHVSVRNLLTKLMNDFSSLLHKLKSMLLANNITEALMTKLEFTSLSLISASHNPLSLIGSESFEMVRSSFSRILIEIFKSYPSQQVFLLDELISNMKKAADFKKNDKKILLSDGNSIHILSHILICFTQDIHFRDLNSRFESAKLASDESDITPILDLACKIQELWSNNRLISNHIFTTLMTDFNKPEDKAATSLFIEDLLKMLSVPDYPNAPNILKGLMEYLLDMAKKDISANVEFYIVDTLSFIASKVYLRKKKSDFVNPEELSIHTYKSNLNVIFGYIHFKRTKDDEFAKCSLSALLMNVISVLYRVYLDKYHGKSAYELSALHSEADSFDYINDEKSEMEDYISLLVSELFQDNGSFKMSISDLDSSAFSSYKLIWVNGILGELLNHVEDFIIFELNNSRIKVRSKAVRALSEIVENNPDLLLTTKIQVKLSTLLSDNSPQVRESIIDLISKYISSHPEVIDSFYIPISECVSDESILVRKRALKVAKNIYKETTSQKILSYVSSRILTRLEDEEELFTNMAVEALHELFFFMIPSDSNGDERRNLIIEVMADIVKTSGKSSQDFEEYCRTYVFGKEVIRTHVEMKRLILKTLSNISFEDATRIDDYLRLISVVVRCRGDLLSQHDLAILQPFLVDDDPKRGMACFYSLEIFRNTLDHANVLSDKFIDNSLSYILNRLGKFNVGELHEAVPVAWKLSQFNNDSAKIINAAISCMRHISLSFEKAKTPNWKFDPKIIKLHHLLGCFGSYCQFEKYKNVFEKASLGLKPHEMVFSLMSKYLLAFCNGNVDSVTRGQAIRNILYMGSSHPKLLLSKTVLTILDDELKIEGNDSVKSIILYGIMDFLKQEDKATKSRTGIEEKNSTKTKLDIDAFYGSGKSYIHDSVCAAVVQRYINQVLNLCLLDEGETSFLAVKFLDLSINLGYANPKVCIPTIFALEASTSAAIKNIAIMLHKKLFNRYESLTDSSYIEGFKLAVAYRTKVSSDLFSEPNFIPQTYTIVSKTYTSRKKFILSLAKSLRFNPKSTDMENVISERNRVIFGVMNFSEIPFLSMEEVMIFISTSNSILSLQGSDFFDLISMITKGQQEVSFEEKVCLCRLCEVMNSIAAFRRYLMSKYGVSVQDLGTYIPGKPSIELRAPPKSVVPGVQLQFDRDDIVDEIFSPDQVETIFANFITTFNGFLDD